MGVKVTQRAEGTPQDRVGQDWEVHTLLSVRTREGWLLAWVTQHFRGIGLARTVVNMIHWD